MFLVAAGLLDDMLASSVLGYTHLETALVTALHGREDPSSAEGCHSG